jgi:two-component system chemotaxis response regulator CheB
LTLRRIRVLLVDDSPIFVRIFADALASRPGRFELCGVAEDGREAVARVDALEPDIIALDVHMPLQGGIETVEHIMSRRPTPILMLTGADGPEQARYSLEAIRRGALDLLPKPITEADYDAVFDRLALLAGVPVVYRHRRTGPLPPLAVGRTPAAPTPHQPLDIVALVASTGGPKALDHVLRALSPDFPLPITIVQHMPAPFVQAFADWLNQVAPLPVQVAQPGCRLAPGTITVAPPEAHLRVDPRRQPWLDRTTPPHTGFRPSGTVLLSSLAESFGPRALGVVLTGMGRDGADGLRALRLAGGLTIAESARTAVVDGMPRAARECRAAAHVLDLDEIGPFIERRAGVARFAETGAGR